MYVCLTPSVSLAPTPPPPPAPPRHSLYSLPRKLRYRPSDTQSRRARSIKRCARLSMAHLIVVFFVLLSHCVESRKEEVKVRERESLRWLDWRHEAGKRDRRSCETSVVFLRNSRTGGFLENWRGIPRSDLVFLSFNPTTLIPKMCLYVYCYRFVSLPT